MKKSFGSIRTKLLLTITVILLVFLLAAMGGLYFFQKDALTKHSIKIVTEISRVIYTGLKYQMLTGNPELTQNLIDEIKSDSNVMETYIINSEGVVKFSSNPERVGKKMGKEDAECQTCHRDMAKVKSLTFQTKNSTGITILKNVTPIYNEAPCLKCHRADKKILGLLFIDYSTKDTDTLIISALLRLLLTAVATFIIIALAMLYFTNRWLHKPITLLINGINEIKKGNYENQIHYKGNTEFRILADSFNDMSKSIVANVREIKNKGFELTVLYTIVKKISETIYLEELKIIVIDLLLEILNSGKCMVITPTPDAGIFDIVEKEQGKEHSQSIIKFSEIDDAAERREPYIAAAFKKWVAKELRAPELSEDSLHAYVPLIIRNHQLCLVIAVRNAENPFDAEGFRLLNVIKEHLAVAFENARLYTLAVTDELTRLFTVRYFQSQMSIAMSRHTRYGQKCSVLMMDIDMFKSVNDNYGHPSGDTVLKEIASVIRDSLRGIDIPCRYGGEEFSVILPETAENVGKVVAERIRANIEKKVIELGSGTNISVTISIGGASCPQQGTQVKDIISAADKALYTAKRTGRNRVVWSG